MLNEKKKTSIFFKKLNRFLTNNWENTIEKQLVKTIYKYKSKIKENEEQGKLYLKKLQDANIKLIEDNASQEFKEELNNLVSEYKTSEENILDNQDEIEDIETDSTDNDENEEKKEKSAVSKIKKDKRLADIDTNKEKDKVEESEEINELQNSTKYFNKKQRKLYSDQPYISENKTCKIMITREHLSEFFSIIENSQAQKLWEGHLTQLNESSDLQDDLLIASGIINSFNLNKRAEQFFNESITVKENYLYRPTGDYKYKVKLHMNPYADKESCIYFDNQETAEKYAKDSKGKYEYVGLGGNSIRESYSKNTVESLIQKLKDFNWYGELNASTLKEADRYTSDKKEIERLVERCGDLGVQIYDKYCPWKKVQRLKEEFGGTAGFTLNKDSVGYNTNPMNTAIHEACDEVMNEYGSRANKMARKGKGKIFDNEDKLEETTDSLDDTDYDTGIYVESTENKSSDFTTKGLFDKVVKKTMPYIFNIGESKFKLFLSGRTKEFILLNETEDEVNYRTKSLPKMIKNIETIISSYDSIDLNESLSEDYAELDSINETDQIADDILFDEEELNEEKYPWKDCIKDQKKEYGSKKTAEKVCGSIKARNESENKVRNILNSLYESIK